MQFLITGHPRSGTGYMAALFRHFGYKVGHERIEKHGISAWQFAVPDMPLWWTETEATRERYNFTHLIHVVRDPFKVLDSSYWTKRTSLLREPYCDTTGSSPIEQEMKSIINWNKLIAAQKPALTVKVEDAYGTVIEWLKANNLWKGLKGEAPSTQTNGRQKGRKSFPQSLVLSGPCHDTINAFKEHTAHYGYSLEEEAQEERLLVVA